MSRLAGTIRRGVVRWGECFDASDLEAVHPSILAAYESGARVEVTSTYEDGETFTRRGRVSVTTERKPAFLLVHRTSDSGSWDVLFPGDVVVKVVAR